MALLTLALWAAGAAAPRVDVLYMPPGCLGTASTSIK